MIAQTATRIRAQIEEFSGTLSRPLGKVARRLVAEMIAGMAARQSVRLSEVARSLEEPIAVRKTVTRLSANLARPEIRPVVQRALAAAGASRVGRDTLLVLDLSDVVKPYAEKMEYLARVRDGSRKELADGYWLCQVIGVEPEGSEITPLYGELYSQEAPDFVSENEEIFKALRLVSRAVEGRGTWVIDRGGDRREVYDEVVPPEKGRRFLIRQKGDRHLLCGMRKAATVEIARRCPLPYATTIVREEAGSERAVTLEYGFRAVRLPEHTDVPLWLVVARGLGAEPLMLLTNAPLRRNRAILWRAVSAYLTRWRIEDAIRLTKQSYRLEDVRVLTYDRLRNLVVLVTAALFFTCVVLGARMKLHVLATHVLQAAKRLFGVPDFRYYALADGLRELLTRFPRRAPPPPERRGTERQQLLRFVT
jgi:hypothetical protein